MTDVGIYKEKEFKKKVRTNHVIDQVLRKKGINQEKKSFKILPFFFYKFPPVNNSSLHRYTNTSIIGIYIVFWSLHEVLWSLNKGSLVTEQGFPGH